MLETPPEIITQLIPHPIRCTCQRIWMMCGNSVRQPSSQRILIIVTTALSTAASKPRNVLLRFAVGRWANVPDVYTFSDRCFSIWNHYPQTRKNDVQFVWGLRNRFRGSLPVDGQSCVKSASSISQVDMNYWLGNHDPRMNCWWFHFTHFFSTVPGIIQSIWQPVLQVETTMWMEDRVGEFDFTASKGYLRIRIDTLSPTYNQWMGESFNWFSVGDRSFIKYLFSNSCHALHHFPWIKHQFL